MKPKQNQDAYNGIRGRPGQQRSTTQLINASIQRKGSKLQQVSEPGRWFHKQFAHIVQSYTDEWGEGMLESAAAKQLGGDDKLQEALQKGHAMQKDQAGTGIPLIYLPKSKIGKREIFETQRGGKDCCESKQS